MKISVFGLGYVGAVSCGCLAELGHEVVGVDLSEQKVELINRGKSPIVEEGLEERLARAVENKKLHATVDAREAVEASDTAIICVGTPSTPTGGVRTTYLEKVCREIGSTLRDSDHSRFTVMVRSTALPPVHRLLQEVLTESSGRRIGETLGYVCHPELLREGTAVRDFYEPPKIVFGVADEDSRAVCEQLYPGIEAPTDYVTPDVAAMIKYADNCFHAVKITFANEIGTMSHVMGVDGQEVMRIVCKDTKLNISTYYLRPGGAFGGSCLPKDLRAILDAARLDAVTTPLLASTLDSNRQQVQSLVARILRESDKPRPCVGLVGLAFKQGTDDVRESPMVSLVEQVLGKGCEVSIFDQHLAIQNMVGSNRKFAMESIPHLAKLLTDDLPKLVAGSDVVVVSHGLEPEVWAQVEWSGQRIIDTVGVDAIRGVPGYEGLYWGA